MVFPPADLCPKKKRESKKLINFQFNFQSKAAAKRWCDKKQSIKATQRAIKCRIRSASIPTAIRTEHIEQVGPFEHIATFR